jgi:hypothetical protein
VLSDDGAQVEVHPIAFDISALSPATRAAQTRLLQLQTSLFLVPPDRMGRPAVPFWTKTAPRGPPAVA